jgi:hypothetical protein
VERDVKTGAAGNAMTRRQFIGEILIPSIILVAVILTLPYYANSVYVDVTAGRQRIVKRVYQIPITASVQDTFFTEQYKKYVNSELPKPKWWLFSKTEHSIILGKTYSDNMEPSGFAQPQQFQENILTEKTFADADAWKKFLTTLTAIYELPESEIVRGGTALLYRVDTITLRATLKRPLRSSDLQSMEEIQRYATELAGRK